ncbi:MAG: hypothetical protein JWM05_2491, partial [Acidimicrobiales bacterium]|nr:hypothetical protein [Acidimicrobiales bacterium]
SYARPEPMPELDPFAHGDPFADITVPANPDAPTQRVPPAADDPHARRRGRRRRP